MNEDGITAQVECKRKAIPITTEELTQSQIFSENTSATYLEIKNKELKPQPYWALHIHQKYCYAVPNIKHGK